MYPASDRRGRDFSPDWKYRQPELQRAAKDILQAGDTAGNRQMAKRTSSVSLAGDPASLPDVL